MRDRLAGLGGVDTVPATGRDLWVSMGGVHRGAGLRAQREHRAGRPAPERDRSGPAAGRPGPRRRRRARRFRGAPSRRAVVRAQVWGVPIVEPGDRTTGRTSGPRSTRASPRPSACWVASDAVDTRLRCVTTATDPSDLDDHALAAWLADAAGERLLEVRQQGLVGRELKDAGDRAAQDVLARLLAEHRPDDAVLSEEAADDKARLTRSPGLDHRPARRHAGVLRAAARRLGGPRRPVGGRRADGGRGGAAGARRDVRYRAPTRRTSADQHAVRGSRSRAPVRPRSSRRWPPRSTPSWSRWARPGSR